MEHFEDKVAVVTGGASGIGRALVDRFAAAGMTVVLADVEKPALSAAVAEVESTGASVLGVEVDVASADSVFALRDRVYEQYGTAHVVCLNAGVAPTGRLLETSLADWRWLVDVNVLGVGYGVSAFGPRLVEQGEGHIVCTASAAGLMATPGLGAYCATKHAVVGLAETLFQELRGTGVGVSVLCPMLVSTRIFESERNRPDQLGGASYQADEYRSGLQAAIGAMGIPASQVADDVFDAIVADRLYVLPHPEVADFVGARWDAVLSGMNPGSIGSA